MRNIVQTLFAAQQKLLSLAATPSRQSELEHLRDQVPAAALAHFLRLLSQGRKAVALVQHGVCSVCHLRIPSATVAALAQPHDLHLCENCGCYLLLPTSETPATLSRPTPIARRGRKSRAALAA